MKGIRERKKKIIKTVTETGDKWRGWERKKKINKRRNAEKIKKKTHTIKGGERK